jgi:hypothetical protein
MDLLKYKEIRFKEFQFSICDVITHQLTQDRPDAGGSKYHWNVGKLRTTRHCNPEDNHLHTHRRENLKSYLENYTVSNVWLYSIRTERLGLVIWEVFGSNFGPEIG